jgi:hypothetical protein
VDFIKFNKTKASYELKQKIRPWSGFF